MSTPTKLPSADTNFKQKQATLAKFATNIYTLMGNAVGLVNFPSPPIALTVLVGYINTYTNSLAIARKGSKTQTQSKNDARANLENALRTNAIYVTNQSLLQVSQLGGPATKSTISILREFIATSGYKISKQSNPVANIVGVKIPITKKMLSKAPGTLHILLRQYTRFKKGTKTWQVQYRLSVTPPTPVNPWITSLQTSGNITITGLPSGKYDVQVAAIGGHNTRTNSQNPLNYSPIKQIVVT